MEHIVKSPEKQGAAQQGGAESGVLGGEMPCELAEVLKAWPTLRADVRTNIVAMVRAEGGATA